MRRLFAWLLLLPLLAACTHMPEFQLVDQDQRERMIATSKAPFPQGRWQLVHQITAQYRGGGQAVLTGVVVLSPADDTIHCVLMALDGFVLFEAVDGDELTVKRGFGPFGNYEFAKGVMRDIRLMFFAPDTVPEICGTLADGGQGCRYRTRSGPIVDIIQSDGNQWLIRQYGPHRTVVAKGVDADGIAGHMTISAGGTTGYRLAMELIEKIQLP